MMIAPAAEAALECGFFLSDGWRRRRDIFGRFFLQSDRRRALFGRPPGRRGAKLFFLVCSAAMAAGCELPGRARRSRALRNAVVALPASRKSFFCPFEYGRTYFAGISRAS